MSSFYTSVPKIIITCYPEIQCKTDVIVIFHFGLFFCPFFLPPFPLTAQKLKMKKKKKKMHGDIIILFNYDQMMYSS